MTRSVLVAILLLFSASSHAENMVATDQAGNILTLHAEKCVISPWTNEWYTASFQYQGKMYAACWRLQGESVVVIDSGGDVTSVPMRAFKPETKV